MFTTGDIIANKYEIDRVVAQTENSILYCAKDVNLGKQWAVKQIKPDTKIIESAKREAHVLITLDHPFIPRVVEMFEENITGDTPTTFIVMDFIEGENLEVKLNKGVKFSETMVVQIGKDILSVLSYLHSKNIIYRDLKPANIMLRPDGSIRVVDFGIVSLDEDHSNHANLGTMGYAAPEQHGYNGKIDERTDLYSLGVTLHTLLTGKKPDEPPLEMLPAIYYDASLSEALSTVIEKAVSEDPQLRYQSDYAFLKALTDYNTAPSKPARSLFGGKPQVSPYKQRVEIKKPRMKPLSPRSFILFACLLIVLVAGAFTAHTVTTNNHYNSLVSVNTRESYVSAIKYQPEKYQAYFKFIDSFTEISENDSMEILNIVGTYSPNLNKKKEDWSLLNWEISEKYLTVYDTPSDRNKLAIALPFLEESSEPEAVAYRELYFLLDKYVFVSSNSSITTEISESDVIEMVDLINEVTVFAQNAPDETRTSFVLMSGDIGVAAINSVAGEYLSYDTIDSLKSTVKNIEASTKKTNPRDQSLSDKKINLLSSLLTVNEKLDGIEKEKQK